MPGTALPKTPLDWVDRHGSRKPVSPRGAYYKHPRLSPDGGSLAVTMLGANNDLWVYEMARDMWTKPTDEDGGEFITVTVWTHNGARK